MFASASATPRVDMGRGYAAAVSSAAPTSSRGASAGRTAVVAVSAALALGVSALVGGSLLYSASRRTEDSSKAAPAATSWWQRAVVFVRLRTSAEDDEDAFASGTGAASLFDAEKTKARQLSKGKAAPATRTSAAATATSASLTRKRDRMGGAARPIPDVLTAIGYPSDIDERTRHIKLVRALLRREAGIEYSDDDGESTSSDETDVSLNYHFASTMEATARDALLMAFAHFEDFTEGAIFGKAVQLEGKGAEKKAESLQVKILVKILEYLDMSNEREKLRYRRIALYREQGRETPASSVDDAADGEDDEEDEENPIDALYRQLGVPSSAQKSHGRFGGFEMGEDEEVDEDFLPASAAAQQSQYLKAMFGHTMIDAGSRAGDANNGDAILNRVLGQQATTGAAAAAAATTAGATRGHALSAQPRSGAAARMAGEADMMEDGWDDEDGEEADFMAFLQQPDDAAHFYSRSAMRQARRDPGNDVRFVGPAGALFGLDGGDDEQEWEDEGDDGDEEEDDDDMLPAKPWSRSDKAHFERELFDRIFQLASSYALTAAVAEREADEEDARKLAERQQRRQKQQPPAEKAQAQAPVAGTSKAPKPAAAAAMDEDEDEWEDEDDEGEWGDEDDA